MKSSRSPSNNKKKPPGANDQREAEQTNPHSNAPAPLITLTTDYGESDYFVGSVKGVLLQYAPNARLIDITHGIPPQDIVSAAFVIKEASRYFPPGSIHLVVVDPGVGSRRRMIITRAEDRLFVAPDNGVLTYLIQAEGETYEVGKPEFLPLKESRTFAGRDCFAPIAAFLAQGYSPSDFGKRISDPHLLEGIRPEKEESQIRGKIVYIDHFGNAITNLTWPDFKAFAPARFTLEVKGHIFHHLNNHYSEGDQNAGLLLNSSGHLEIFSRNRNARTLLDLNLLDEVILRKG